MEEKVTDGKPRTACDSWSPAAWNEEQDSAQQGTTLHSSPGAAGSAPGQGECRSTGVCPRAVTPSSDIPFFSSTDEWSPLLKTKRDFRPLYLKPSQTKKYVFIMK